MFKILTVANEVESQVAARHAREAFQKGDMDTAEQEASHALSANPKNVDAEQILEHAFSLKNKGFSASHGTDR